MRIQSWMRSPIADSRASLTVGRGVIDLLESAFSDTLDAGMKETGVAAIGTRLRLVTSGGPGKGESGELEMMMSMLGGESLETGAW